MLFSNSPVTQRCANISASVSKSLVDADGEDVQLSIETDSDCNWTLLRDNQAMLSIVGSTSGAGNGSATIRVSPHSGPAERSGWVYVDTGTVNFQEVRIRQRARAGCNVDATPNEADVDAFGESRTLQVDADDNDCAWTVSAATESPWIEIPQGVAVGRGDGTVDYNVLANASRQRREGRIFVNQEREITIIQQGQPCDFQLSETQRDIGNGPFLGSVGVTTAPSDCQWGIFVNPGSDWIRVNGAQTRLGGDSVSLEATENTSRSSREGFVQIAGITYTLRQAGAVTPNCVYGLSATSGNFGGGGGSGSVDLFTSSSCEWTASVQSGAEWIHLVSGASGAGAVTVRFQLDANPSSSERVGVISVAGVPYTVRQAGQTVVGPAPEIASGGVVEAARYQAVLTPGAIGTVFGSKFADQPAYAESVPLPTELGGVRVTVNGVEAALFYADGGQINFQVPTGLPTSGQYTVVVYHNGQASAPAMVDAAEYAPAVYRYNDGSGLRTIAVHADNQLITQANPIKAGEPFIIYLNGLGGLLNGASTGQPAGSSPLVTTRLLPTVTLGGAPVKQLLFSGITPGSVGLGQINVVAPDPLPFGASLDLLIAFGAATSPPAPLPAMQPPPREDDDVSAAILSVQPSTARAGDQVDVAYSLSTTTGFRGNVGVQVFVSEDATIQPGVDRAVSSGVDGLESDSDSFAQSFTVPDDLEPGFYWVGVAIVSPADKNPVNDASGARRVTVLSPTPTGVGVTLNAVSPASAGLQGPIDVDFTLSNPGDPAEVEYSVYISADSTITPADSLVEKSTALVTREARVQRQDLVLPAGLTAGQYFIGVTARFVTGGTAATSNVIAVELSGTSGSLTANPNPILTCPPNASTTLSWTTSGVTRGFDPPGRPLGNGGDQRRLERQLHGERRDGRSRVLLAERLRRSAADG